MEELRMQRGCESQCGHSNKEFSEAFDYLYQLNIRFMGIPQSHTIYLLLFLVKLQLQNRANRKQNSF